VPGAGRRRRSLVFGDHAAQQLVGDVGVSEAALRLRQGHQGVGGLRPVAVLQVVFEEGGGALGVVEVLEPDHRRFEARLVAAAPVVEGHDLFVGGDRGAPTPGPLPCFGHHQPRIDVAWVLPQVRLGHQVNGVGVARLDPTAPFVEVGARVAAGQPVGLVEVMKTFNQIHYGGPGWPEHAEVVEVRADDGEEVSAGQVLIVVR